MKIETKTVTVEKEVYIASDGTEFDGLIECKDYEYRLLASKLDMYDYNLNKCKDLDQFYFVKLDTDKDVSMLRELCAYFGYHSKGLDRPGIYMYTDKQYRNLSEIVDHINNGGVEDV